MINCVITSPNNTKTYKNIKSIKLPGFFGEIYILPGHAETFILLGNGVISLQQSDKESKVKVDSNGECFIKDDVVTVIL